MKRLGIEKKKLFFYVLALIIFIEPQCFKEPGSQVYYVDYIYKVLKLIIGFIIVLKYLLSQKKIKKTDKFIYFTFLFEILMFISTIINKGDMFRFAGPSITVISMALLSKSIIDSNLLLDVVKKLNCYFFICYIINLVSIFYIGLSDTAIYFLGIDNRFIWTFFPWIICEGIESLLEKGKFTKKYFLTFALIEFVLIYKWSASAMLAMGLFILPSFIKYKRIGYKILNIANIVINFIITKVNLAKVGLLNYIVIDLLHKDMTYSGRTLIWNGIYKAIEKKPMLGYGTQSIVNERSFFFSTSGGYQLEFLRVMHAHNSFMTILYRGGILSLGSYIGVLFVTIKSLCNNKNDILFPLLMTGMIVILALSFFDTIDLAFLFFFFGVCNYSYLIMRERVN